MKVQILMATYNGEQYLAEQIDSILAQNITNVDILISDDGSADDTLEIIKKYQLKFPDKISFLAGPSEGFAKNFLFLLEKSSPDADFYAFSDQDDVWKEDKIRAAIDSICAIKKNSGPVLYCSSVTPVDSKLRVIDKDRLPVKPVSFVGSLLHNVAPGNTMVFNSIARNLLIKAGSRVNIPFHDWWVYFLVSACGGAVIGDERSYVLYRQHDSNLIGMQKSNRLTEIRSRIFSILDSWGAEVNSIHIAEISVLWEDLHPSVREKIGFLMRARNCTCPFHLYYYMRLGFRSRSLVNFMGILSKIILRRI